MGRPRSFSKSFPRQEIRKGPKCRCGAFLAYEGNRVLTSRGRIGASIGQYLMLRTGVRAEWSGQKLFAVWRCPRCGRVFLDKAKKS
jgi:ribosomal protein S27AE